MSGAIFRVRKRITARMNEHPAVTAVGAPTMTVADSIEIAAYRWCIRVIDEEIEKDAEKEFTRPIRTDIVTDIAREVKE